MTIGTFINKLNSIKDHNSTVYFNYGSEYPAVKVVVGSDPFDNEACVVIKNCNVNERKQVLTIYDLIHKFGLIKSLSKDALVYIEAVGYKGLPEAVNSVKECNLSNNFKKVIISNSKEVKVDPEYAEYLRLKNKFESKVH